MFSKTALVVSLALAAGARAEQDEQACSSSESPRSPAQKYTQSFDAFSLTYFDGRGLAEVPRTLFATVGRFPGSGFEDVRYTKEQFDEAKGKGDLAKNLNRVPVLNHNGAVIGQSKAIARYLAGQFGLLGSTAQEAAQIDAMCEHVVDIQAAWRNVLPYKNKFTDEETAAANQVWFETAASPPIEGRKERQLQWFLDQVENALPGDGYTVGGRPSLVDAYLYNMLGETAPEVEPKKKGEPFGSLAAVTKVLEQYPKLKSVLDTFGGSPGMVHYLATRGEQAW